MLLSFSVYHFNYNNLNVVYFSTNERLVTLMLNKRDIGECRKIVKICRGYISVIKKCFLISMYEKFYTHRKGKRWNKVISD